MRGFDLATLDTPTAMAQGAPMTVEHPASGEVLTFTDADGAERPVTITLLGMDAPELRELVRERQRRRLKQKKNEITVEELEREELKFLAAATTGWQGVEWRGQTLVFSTSNAIMLYGALPWLRRKVDAFIAEVGNFLGSSSTPSSPSPSTPGGSPSDQTAAS